jgi:large subunit ribosomal protein L25
MAQAVLAARVRQTKGKGAARKLRKKSQIPAVFYGPKSEPVMLALDYPELEQVLQNATSENIIFDLKIQSDKGSDTRKAILKDLQVDPVKRTYLHVDLYEISMDKEITVNVPIRLIGNPIGVTNGGVLQHIRRELEVSCLPDRLIDALDLDVSRLDIGDSLHISDIELPEGTRSAQDEHLTIAVVAAPTVSIEEEIEEEVELEGEAEAEAEEEAEPAAESTEES